jgi:hypothetical protein
MQHRFSIFIDVYNRKAILKNMSNSDSHIKQMELKDETKQKHLKVALWAGLKGSLIGGVLGGALTLILLKRSPKFRSFTNVSVRTVSFIMFV